MRRSVALRFHIPPLIWKRRATERLMGPLGNQHTATYMRRIQHPMEPSNGICPHIWKRISRIWMMKASGKHSTFWHVMGRISTLMCYNISPYEAVCILWIITTYFFHCNQKNNCQLVKTMVPCIVFTKQLWENSNPAWYIMEVWAWNNSWCTPLIF